MSTPEQDAYRDAVFGAEAKKLIDENDKLKAALSKIKSLVCGDKHPRWKDDWRVTHMRGLIADICEIAE